MCLEFLSINPFNNLNYKKTVEKNYFLKKMKNKIKIKKILFLFRNNLFFERLNHIQKI